VGVSSWHTVERDEREEGLTSVGGNSGSERTLEATVGGSSTELVDGRVRGRVREGDTRRSGTSESSLVLCGMKQKSQHASFRIHYSEKLLTM